MAVLSEPYQQVPTLLLLSEALVSILEKAMRILDPDLTGIAEPGNGEWTIYS